MLDIVNHVKRSKNVINLLCKALEVENVIGLKLMIFDAKVGNFEARNSGFSFYCYSKSISIWLISRCHAHLETHLKSAPHQRSTQSGRAIHEQARQNSLSFLKWRIHSPAETQRKGVCGRTFSLILPAPASVFFWGCPRRLHAGGTRCHTICSLSKTCKLIILTLQVLLKVYSQTRAV